MSKFYVSPETSKGKIVAYQICDRVGGMESQHERFPVHHSSDKAFVFVKAQEKCKEMNAVSEEK